MQTNYLSYLCRSQLLVKARKSPLFLSQTIACRYIQQQDENGILAEC